jgi:hypothetical protein
MLWASDIVEAYAARMVLESRGIRNSVANADEFEH